MSHILLTYHFEILDLLNVTNYIRQNLAANFSASHSVLLSRHLEFSPPTWCPTEFSPGVHILP